MIVSVMSVYSSLLKLSGLFTQQFAVDENEINSTDNLT